MIISLMALLGLTSCGSRPSEAQTDVMDACLKAQGGWQDLGYLAMISGSPAAKPNGLEDYVLDKLKPLGGVVSVSEDAQGIREVYVQSLLKVVAAMRSKSKENLSVALDQFNKAVESLSKTCTSHGFAFDPNDIPKT